MHDPPRGRIGWTNAIGLSVVSLVTGLGMGAGISYLESVFFHLLILFSLAIGAVVGSIAAEVVYRRRVRAALPAAAIAGLGALAAWGTVWGVHYREQRALAREALVRTIEQHEARTGAQVPRDRIVVTINDTMVRAGRGMSLQEAAATAFSTSGERRREGAGASQLAAIGGWIRAELNAGITFEKHSSTVRLGAVGTSILWAIELFLAVGLACELTYKAAERRNLS